MLIKHNKYYSAITLLDSLIAELRDACAQGYSRAFTKFACLQRPAMLMNFLTLGPWRKGRDSNPRTGGPVSSFQDWRNKPSSATLPNAKVSDITNTHQQKNIKKSSSPQPESLLLLQVPLLRVFNVRFKEKENVSFMGAQLRVELRSADNESAMLPLHYRALYRRWSPPSH